MAKHCDNCSCDEKADLAVWRQKQNAVQARLDAGTSFSHSELVYAAHERCVCGAGMAYPIDTPLNGYWDCSAILTGEAKPKGHGESVKHEDRLPFAFYEVKSENQPSAYGATTRPK